MGGKLTKKHSINKENNFFKSQNKYRKKIILVGGSLVKSPFLKGEKGGLSTQKGRDLLRVFVLTPS